jgi:hypothetical protein
MDQGVSARHSSGPKEPLPICLAHKRPSPHVTTTDPCVDVLQYSASIVWVTHFNRVTLAPR